MAILKFDKTSARMIQIKAEAALRDIAEEHGLKVVQAGGSFEDMKFVARFQFTIADATAQEAAAKTEFVENAEWYGMTPEHYGQTFRYGGHGYKIAGLNLNGRGSAKGSIKVQRLDNGKTYTMRGFDVVRLLRAPKYTRAS